MTCSAVLRRDLVPALPLWFRKMKLGDWPMFALVARYGTIELMDEVMAVYRVHSGGTWSSLPLITRLREGTRMLEALDRHLEFQYTDTIRQVIARNYLGLAMTARLNGNRTETAKQLVSCLRNGGWRLHANRRTLAALAAYVLIGSRYSVFLRGRSANRG